MILLQFKKAVYFPVPCDQWFTKLVCICWKFAVFLPESLWAKISGSFTLWGRSHQVSWVWERVRRIECVSSGHESLVGSGVTGGNLEVQQPCEIKMIRKGRHSQDAFFFFFFESVLKLYSDVMRRWSAVKPCRFSRTCCQAGGTSIKARHMVTIATLIKQVTTFTAFHQLLFLLSFFTRNRKKKGGCENKTAPLRFTFTSNRQKDDAAETSRLSCLGAQTEKKERKKKISCLISEGIPPPFWCEWNPRSSLQSGFSGKGAGGIELWLALHLQNAGVSTNLNVSKKKINKSRFQNSSRFWDDEYDSEKKKTRCFSDWLSRI